MKYWQEEDFENLGLSVPEGHRRLILNMTTKLRTPEVKSGRSIIPLYSKQIVGSPEKGCFRSKRDIAVHMKDLPKLHAEKSVDGDACSKEIPPKPKTRKLDMSPVDQYIQSKEQELQPKNDEITQKKTKLYEMMDRIKAAFQRGQKCSNCRKRNHTVRSCTGDKCESSFLCGDLSKHPDEKLAI